MYRRPKFLESLLEVRRAMSAEAGHDTGAFAEMVLSGQVPLFTLDASAPNPVTAPEPAEEAEAVLEGTNQAVS